MALSSGSERRSRADLIAVAICIAVPFGLEFFYAALLKEQFSIKSMWLVHKTFLLFFPLLWLWIATGRFPRPSSPAARGIIPAAGFGLAVGLGAIAIYFLGFSQTFDSSRLKERLAAAGILDHYILFVSLLTLVNSLLEEFYWRFFVYERGLGFTSSLGALRLSSLGFAAFHLPALWLFVGPILAFPCAAGIYAGGYIWGRIYVQSRNLYAVWLSHALVNLSIFFIGYYAVFLQGS